MTTDNLDMTTKTDDDVTTSDLAEIQSFIDELENSDSAAADEVMNMASDNVESAPVESEMVPQVESAVEDTKVPVKASEVTSKPAKKKEDKTPAIPAWVSFTEAVKAHLAAEGLTPGVDEQKGFVHFVNPATQHRLCIAKQGRAVTRVETTLDLVGVLDGAYPLPADKPNGKIACSLEPNQDTVLGAIRILMTSDDKLRASKRTGKAAAKTATPST